MHKGETPAFDRARVANDATYNLATGTQILADKWHATNCVGDNQPRIVEDWYVAAWAYNGLAFVNNPNNPNYSATRGVCEPERRLHGALSGAHLRLDGAPADGGALDARWRSPIPIAPTSRRRAPRSPDLPEPKCASPTDCTQTRPTHTSACLDATDVDGGGGGDDGGGAPGDLSAGGKSGGCGCDLGRRPPINDALLVIAGLALGFALRYKRRA